MKVLITDISWDLDGETLAEYGDYDLAVRKLGLPGSAECAFDDGDYTDEEIEDMAGDFLSDVYGYCFNGFKYTTVGENRP